MNRERGETFNIFLGSGTFVPLYHFLQKMNLDVSDFLKLCNLNALMFEIKQVEKYKTVIGFETSETSKSCTFVRGLKLM